MNLYCSFKEPALGFVDHLYFFLISVLIAISLIFQTVSLLKGFNKVPESFPSIMKSDRF